MEEKKLNYILENYYLNEKQIENIILNDQFNNNLNNILQHQQLSEQFIEKNFNKLNEKNWNNIFHYQQLSENFINKYFDIWIKQPLPKEVGDF